MSIVLAPLQDEVLRRNRGCARVELELGGVDEYSRVVVTGFAAR